MHVNVHDPRWPELLASSYHSLIDWFEFGLPGGLRVTRRPAARGWQVDVTRPGTHEPAVSVWVVQEFVGGPDELPDAGWHLRDPGRHPDSPPVLTSQAVAHALGRLGA